MKIVGSFIDRSMASSDLSSIGFTINPEVTITESYIPEFSVSTFFADLGGSLGLWLGVGAVQLLSMGVTLLRRTKTMLFKK